MDKQTKFNFSDIYGEFNISDIKKAFDFIQHIPKAPDLIKINGGWLQLQIEAGRITEANCEPDKSQIWGLPVEITDEVDTIEYVYYKEEE